MATFYINAKRYWIALLMMRLSYFTLRTIQSKKDNQVNRFKRSWLSYAYFSTPLSGILLIKLSLTSDPYNTCNWILISNRLIFGKSDHIFWTKPSTRLCLLATNWGTNSPSWSLGSSMLTDLIQVISCLANYHYVN